MIPYLFQGSVQYLVRWKGLPRSEDSWIDEENLSADELVNKFECMQGRMLANLPENYAICHQCRKKRVCISFFFIGVWVCASPCDMLYGVFVSTIILYLTYPRMYICFSSVCGILSE